MGPNPRFSWVPGSPVLVLNSTMVDFRRFILVARGAFPPPRVYGSSGEPKVRSDSDLGSRRVGFAATDLHAAAHTRFLNSAQRVSPVSHVTHLSRTPWLCPIGSGFPGVVPVLDFINCPGAVRATRFPNLVRTSVCGPILRACPSFRPPRALSNAPPACPSAAARGCMTGGGLMRSGAQPEMGQHTHTESTLGNHELFGDMHQNQADHGDFLLVL